MGYWDYSSYGGVPQYHDGLPAQTLTSGDRGGAYQQPNPQYAPLAAQAAAPTAAWKPPTLQNGKFASQADVDAFKAALKPKSYGTIASGEHGTGGGPAYSPSDTTNMAAAQQWGVEQGILPKPSNSGGLPGLSSWSDFMSTWAPILAVMAAPIAGAVGGIGAGAGGSAVTGLGEGAAAGGSVGAGSFAGATGIGAGASAGGTLATGGGSAVGGGAGGSGFSMEGGLNAAPATGTGAGMSAAAGAPAYAGQVGAAADLSTAAGGFGSSMPASVVGAGGAGAASGAGAGAGGLFGSGISAPTALGGLGLLNNIYQSSQDHSLANSAADRADSLAQPQRKPYQDLLSSYFNGGQDITKQPIFANALDLMNRQSTARMASQNATGNQGAMAQEFNKNATQQLNASALPYLQQLSGQAGFGFPALGTSGSLYGQYNAAGNQQVSNGLYNLGNLAGLNSATGSNNTSMPNIQTWPGDTSNSSGSGNGTLGGASYYSRA